MLIFFRLTDGSIVHRGGTSNLLPLGRVDAEEEFALNVEQLGFTRKDVDWIRVQPDIASGLAGRAAHVDTATRVVVDDGPRLQDAPTRIEELRSKGWDSITVAEKDEAMRLIFEGGR